MRLKSTVLPVTLAALAAGPADANPVKSQYTTIDLHSCRKTKQHRHGANWRCPGLPGYPVWLAEGDLRTFVSVGDHAEKRRAAGQTLGPFNTIFAQGSKRTTLEWRFDRRRSALVPYATILRYFTNGEAGRGEVLVVAKVSKTDSCHVAHIDALATPEPIVLAHKIADETARTFDCSKEPINAGAAGNAPL